MDIPSPSPDGPDGESTTPPVTLGCASADESIARQTADALMARGYRVELAAALHDGPDSLSAAIDTLSGNGLYVLCRSQALDRAAIDGLRQVLRDRGVPFGRTLTLAVETQSARDLEERIVSVLRRMVTGRPEAAAAEPPSAPPVDAGAQHAAMLPPPPQAVAASPAASVHEGVMPPAYSGDDHTEVAIPATPAPIDALGSSHEYSTPNVVSASTAGGASVSGSALMEPPLTFGGRMGRFLSSPTGLISVVGGVAVILAVAVGVSMSGDDDDDDVDKVAANEEPKASDKDDKDDSASAKTAEQSDDEKPPTSDGDDAPDDEPEPSGEADAVAEAVVAQPPPSTIALVGDPPPPLPSRDFSAGDDPPEVVEALLGREVRALDVFLVAPERPGTLGYARAVEYCKGLEVSGLGDWRVPAIGEINAIGTADMLGRSIYWSATAGDTFGDRMLVLNMQKKRISVVDSTWDGAKVVCVRLRQG